MKYKAALLLLFGLIFASQSYGETYRVWKIDEKVLEKVADYRSRAFDSTTLKALDGKDVPEFEEQFRKLIAKDYSYKKIAQSKDISEEQREKLLAILEEYSLNSKRLHDEGNSCALAVKMESLNYVVADDEDAEKIKHRIIIWQKMLRGFRDDAFLNKLNCSKGFWSVLTKEQREVFLGKNYDVSKIGSYGGGFPVEGRVNQLLGLNKKKKIEHGPRSQKIIEEGRKKYKVLMDQYYKLKLDREVILSNSLEVPMAYAFKVHKDYFSVRAEIDILSCETLRELIKDKTQNNPELMEKAKDSVREIEATHMAKIRGKYYKANGKGLVDRLDGR